MQSKDPVQHLGRNGSSTSLARPAVVRLCRDDLYKPGFSVIIYADLAIANHLGRQKRRSPEEVQEFGKIHTLCRSTTAGRMQVCCFQPLSTSTRHPGTEAAVASTPQERHYRMPHCPRSRATSITHLLLAVWPRTISQRCRLHSHRTI